MVDTKKKTKEKLSRFKSRMKEMSMKKQFFDKLEKVYADEEPVTEEDLDEEEYEDEEY